MLNKLEIINFASYLDDNDIQVYNKYIVTNGLRGINVFPKNLANLNKNKYLSKYNLFLDSYRPVLDFDSYWLLLEGLNPCYSPEWFNIPIYTNQKFIDNELSDLLSITKKIRFCINLDFFSELNEIKILIDQISSVGLSEIVLYYSDKNSYNLLDQVIITDRVLNNSKLNVTIFGRISYKQLSKYPIFNESRVVGIGTSILGVLDCIKNSV